jgi:single-strand DNA-binding protein
VGYQIVVVIGRLGADPEVRTSKSGQPIANLRIAVGERVKKGDEYVEETEWFRAVCFGKTAEIAAKYLSKGSEVSVQGRMHTRKWQDKDGKDQYSTELTIDRLTLIGGGSGKREADPNPTGLPDDDLPF